MIFLILNDRWAYAIHGGIILALASKEAVTLSVDSRFSSAQTGNLLLGTYYKFTTYLFKKC